jgi:hypothetical protein
MGVGIEGGCPVDVADKSVRTGSLGIVSTPETNWGEVEESGGGGDCGFC